MKEGIKELIENMTPDEMKRRLAEYMAADLELQPKVVAAEVRLSREEKAKCRYEVLLIDEEGGEITVNFKDRSSRLVYIYSLLHPNGYQRHQAAAGCYAKLCQLYTMLYFKDSKALRKSIGDDFDHFFSQAVAQSRIAIRRASAQAEAFIIDRPQLHFGRTLIPAASHRGSVIMDASLLNTISNH